MAAGNCGGCVTPSCSRQLYLKCSSQYIPCPEALGYTTGKTLGSGTYAKVKAAWSPYEGRMIALKILNKKQAPRDYLTKFLPSEISILQWVAHPNIVRVFQIVETDLRCFFAMEIAENGDLLDYINSRKSLPEAEARFIFNQMCQAISYCHSLNIAHRDLKCENVMLSKAMDVKIGDFGFAINLTHKSCSTPCGSYSYAAPELFTANGKQYNGKKADSWSMGVILYAMVCGRLPFGDDAEVKRMPAQHRRLEFSKDLTTDCKSLIQSVLNIDVESRPFVLNVMTYTWMLITPSTRPRQVPPGLGSSKHKYTIDTCLPSSLHSVKPRSFDSLETTWNQMAVSPYPSTLPYTTLFNQQLGCPSDCKASVDGAVDVACQGKRTVACGSLAETLPAVKEPGRQIVSKIGAARRRLADAVKGVKHDIHKY